MLRGELVNAGRGHVGVEVDFLSADLDPVKGEGGHRGIGNDQVVRPRKGAFSDELREDR